MSELTFEHTYSSVLSELIRRLRESAPSRIQLLTGPRQVGKTTLLGPLEAQWGDRAIYVAADVPEAVLPGWWERQWLRARELAAKAPGAVLLIDEAHVLPDWSRLLKIETDRLHRENTPLHVVVTGSSALRLSAGSKETMAGRFERLRLMHWPAAELIGQLGLDRDEAVRLVVTHGSYPGSLKLRFDTRRFRHYLHDSIIEPAIGRDLVALESVRKPALLRQIFAIAAGHPAHVMSLQKIRGSLTDKGSLATVAHYLSLLEEACLVVGLKKFSNNMVRQRAAPPKLITLNNGLLLSKNELDADTRTIDPARWGRLVENACAAMAWNSGQNVSYWREEPLEVDFISEGSWGRFAVEVKTGNYTTRDLQGLLEFQRRYPEFIPLVICDSGNETIAKRMGLPVILWEKYLFEGPCRAFR